MGKQQPMPNDGKCPDGYIYISGQGCVRDINPSIVKGEDEEASNEEQSEDKDAED